MTELTEKYINCVEMNETMQFILAKLVLVGRELPVAGGSFTWQEVQELLKPAMNYFQFMSKAQLDEMVRR